MHKINLVDKKIMITTEQKANLRIIIKILNHTGSEYWDFVTLYLSHPHFTKTIQLILLDLGFEFKHNCTISLEAVRYFSKKAVIY